MIQTRSKVFETNSSSSHSLTIAKDALVDTPFSSDILREGSLILEGGSYHWEWLRLDTAESKLNYIFTAILGYSWPTKGTAADAMEEATDRHSFLSRICAIVKDFTGVTLLLEPGESSYRGIDGQSTGRASALRDLTDDELKTFLFSKENYIQLGNDNDLAPFMVQAESQSEKVPFYSKNILEVPARGVTVKVTYDQTQLAPGFANEATSPTVKVTLKKGVTHNILFNSPAFDMLKAHFAVQSADVKCKYFYDLTEYATPLEVVSGMLVEDNFKMTLDLAVAYRYTEVKMGAHDKYATVVTLKGKISPEHLAQFEALLAA